MPKLESKFQAGLRKRIEDRFPGCIVMKNDAGAIQGIPDLLILYGSRWASLECKRNEKAHRQPNQEYYVGRMNDMSFSRFIFPENEKTVLDEMERYFNI